MSDPSAPDPEPTGQDWPGRRLGRPRSGPGSIARPGRRIAGLAIDWMIAAVIAYALFDYDALALMLIWMGAQIVFSATIASSVGQRIVGLRLERVTGGYAGLVRPIIRTLLLALIIPALIWDADQRGLHDKAAGTILVRR
ncbi:MAG: RDD family protein [Microbacteriaceae bacterium]